MAATTMCVSVIKKKKHACTQFCQFAPSVLFSLKFGTGKENVTFSSFGVQYLVTFMFLTAFSPTMNVNQPNQKKKLSSGLPYCQFLMDHHIEYTKTCTHKNHLY